MSVRVKLADLDPLFTRAFARSVHDYAEEVRREFDSPVWSWPTTTKRRSGQTVGSPRNLVDTGELKGSQSPPQIAGLNARITWDADHAAAVFLGAVFRDRRSTPARNLPLHVARHFNFATAFLEAL